MDGICNPSLSIVIILAGTNDIGQLTSSVGSNIDAQKVVQPIIKLHKTCLNSVDDNSLDKNIHTIAIGIPSSEWQVMNQDAATLCNDMNKALQQFASTENRVSFIDFPFQYERGGVNWSRDGLHFSPEGYKTLGKALAPCVKQILEDL